MHRLDINVMVTGTFFNVNSAVWKLESFVKKIMTVLLKEYVGLPFEHIGREMLPYCKVRIEKSKFLHDN